MTTAPRARLLTVLGRLCGCLFILALFCSRVAAEAKGMVVAGHPLAAQAGAEVLRRGGNAIDAAAAAAMTLWVVEPHGSGLGGEGNFVAWLGKEQKCVAVDFGSRAPLKASLAELRDRQERRRGPKSAAVPGVLKGLALALEKFGTRSVGELLSPAIRHAEDGFAVDPVLARALRANRKALLQYESSRAVFASGGAVLPEGGHLVQKDLAATLRRIAAGGVESFYRGELADAIERQLREHGGLIAKEDLAAYEAREVPALRGNYRGFDLCTSFPPAGGVGLVQMLHVLEGYDLRKLGFGTSESLHLLAEVLKLVDRDRRREVADPRFTTVAIGRLTDKRYAGDLRKLIRAAKTRDPSESKKSESEDFWQEGSTTHLSVVDRWGNAVALTQTLSFLFGSAFVLPGTGILLNNDMNNFSYRKGQANTVAPGKSPRVSRSPTLLIKDGRPTLILGSPGAGRIIPTVAQVIVNVVDHGMQLEGALRAPRFYTRDGFPVDAEEGFSSQALDALRQKGHGVVVKGTLSPYFGGVHAIGRGPGEREWRGAADPRRYGAAVAE